MLFSLSPRRTALPSRKAKAEARDTPAANTTISGVAAIEASSGIERPLKRRTNEEEDGCHSSSDCCICLKSKTDPQAAMQESFERLASLSPEGPVLFRHILPALLDSISRDGTFALQVCVKAVRSFPYRELSS